MANEQLNNKIYQWLCRKFDRLEVNKSPDGNDIYLSYKNENNFQVRIGLRLGIVAFYSGFETKICKFIDLDRDNFRIVLKRWIEEKYQIKIINIYPIAFFQTARD